MLQLHYFPTSHWSRIIALVFAETKLPFNRNFVDITTGANFEPDYMRLNLRGVVPTIVDDSAVVTDGRRIAQYLGDKAESALCPLSDPDYNKWVGVLHDFPLMLFSYAVWVLGLHGEKSAEILDDKIDRSNAYAEAHPDLGTHYRRKAAFFESFNRELLDPSHGAHQEATYETILNELGAHLREREWIAGAFSFADCIATSILWRLVDLGKLNQWSEDASHGLFAYYNRIKARPSFRAVFYDDPLIPEKYRPND